jgi:hypothetical protein
MKLAGWQTVNAMPSPGQCLLRLTSILVENAEWKTMASCPLPVQMPSIDILPYVANLSSLRISVIHKALSLSRMNELVPIVHFPLSVFHHHISTIVCVSTIIHGFLRLRNQICFYTHYPFCLL